MSFRDSGENYIDNIIYWHHIYSSHIFEGNEEDRPNLRLYRFVSLVNNKEKGVPDIHVDYTSVINGVFSRLVIVINTGKALNKTWGIGGDNIETSWKVSPKNIEFGYGIDFDCFSIKYYK